MVHCLSCERYPKDLRVIPYGSEFPLELYKVRLLSSFLPDPMPTSGADVEGLADNTQFAVGSLLYVVNGSQGSEIYVFDSEQFVLWSTASSYPTPEGDQSSDVVDVGEVDYMILTA
jgi:hypothetical protein